MPAVSAPTVYKLITLIESAVVKYMAAVLSPAPLLSLTLIKTLFPVVNLVALAVGSVMNHPVKEPDILVVNSPY